MKLTFKVLLLSVAFAISVHGQWIKQAVNTAASFRGLSVVNEKVVWASGTGGTVIRTIDSGKTWRVMTVPGAEKLDFRDIEAFDANTAYILSIGNGESSRIYKTTDGGTTWKEQFRNKNEKAFFDAIACWDRKNCIAMSDPVDSHFLFTETKDGEKWDEIPSKFYIRAEDGEAAFAASGTCLIALGEFDSYFVSGGSTARVFFSKSRGKEIGMGKARFPRGTAGSGIFSIAMLDAKTGVIVGGNYEKPDEAINNLAFTSDGESWTLGAGLSGYRSAVAYVDRKTIIAVGTNGTDLSKDGGKTWTKIGSENLNAVAAKGKNAVWAVGPNGMVAKLGTGLCTQARWRHLPASVTNLNLSHIEISNTCASNSVSCSNNRSVQLTTVSIEGVESDQYSYNITGGKIIGTGSNVTWDLSDVSPGKYFVTAGIKYPECEGTIYEIPGQSITKELTVR